MGADGSDRVMVAESTKSIALKYDSGQRSFMWSVKATISVGQRAQSLIAAKAQ